MAKLLELALQLLICISLCPGQQLNLSWNFLRLKRCDRCG